MFVTNWISTTKIQKISEITNFFRHYFLSRTEVCIRAKFAINLQMPPKISLPNLIPLSAKFHPHRVKIRYRWNPTTAGFHFLI